MSRRTPNNQIPYLCNICNFKALTEGNENHANAMAGKPLREDTVVHTFQRSANPYNVKIGSDIYIKIAPLITPSTLKSEIKEKFEEEFIPDYDEEITINDEDVAIMEVEIDVHVDEMDEQIEELKNKIKEMEEEHREYNRSMEETHKKE
ncbi:Hypothetical predicted protein [Mytilus galloprovincialis]|uniref:Uncharacterized protein n=1 Tax=Mytilus galloprovincialis TaxID=29158 RepID=A0A8B6D3K3_MYTGA|nr:Hypothetical predicted protein [Mytilus galloprovincialis]